MCLIFLRFFERVCLPSRAIFSFPSPLTLSFLIQTRIFRPRLSAATNEPAELVRAVVSDQRTLGNAKNPLAVHHNGQN